MPPYSQETLEKARKWFESFKEGAKKQGIDLNNPVSAGNVVIVKDNASVAAYSNYMANRNAANMKAVFDEFAKADQMAMMEMDEETGEYAFNRESGQDPVSWMNSFMQNPDTISDNHVVRLYQLAQEKRLFIYSPDTTPDAYAKGTYIMVNNNGEAAFDRIFASGHYEDRLSDYGITRDDFYKLYQRHMENTNKAGEISAALKNIEEDLKKPDISEEERASYQQILDSNEGINCHRYLLAFGQNHPEWFEDENIALNLGRQAYLLGVGTRELTADEVKEVEDNIISSRNEDYTLMHFFKKNSDELFKSDVRDEENKPYPKENSYEFYKALLRDTAMGKRFSVDGKSYRTIASMLMTEVNDADVNYYKDSVLSEIKQYATIGQNIFKGETPKNFAAANPGLKNIAGQCEKINKLVENFEKNFPTGQRDTGELSFYFIDLGVAMNDYLSAARGYYSQKNSDGSVRKLSQDMKKSLIGAIGYENLVLDLKKADGKPYENKEHIIAEKLLNSYIANLPEDDYSDAIAKELLFNRDSRFKLVEQLERSDFVKGIAADEKLDIKELSKKTDPTEMLELIKNARSTSINDRSAMLEGEVEKAINELVLKNELRSIWDVLTEHNDKVGFDKYDIEEYDFTFEGQDILTDNDRDNLINDLKAYEDGLNDRNSFGRSSDNYYAMGDAIYNLHNFMNRNKDLVKRDDLKHELSHTLSKVSTYLAGKGIDVYSSDMNLDKMEFKNDYEEKRVRYAAKIYSDLKKRMKSLEANTQKAIGAEPKPLEKGKLSMLGDTEKFIESMNKKLTSDHSMDGIKKQRFLTETFARFKEELAEVSKDQNFDEKFDADKYQKTIAAYANMISALDETGIEVPGLREALEADLMLLEYADSTGEKNLYDALTKVTQEMIDTPLMNKATAYDIYRESGDINALVQEGKIGVFGGSENYKNIENILKDIGSTARLYENASKEDALKLHEQLEKLKEASETYIKRKMEQPSLKDKELRRVEAAKRALEFADKRLKAMDKRLLPAKNEKFKELFEKAKTAATGKLDIFMKKDPKFMDRMHMIGETSKFADGFMATKTPGRHMIVNIMGAKNGQNTDQYFDQSLKKMVLGAVATNGEPGVEQVLDGRAFGKKYRLDMANIYNKVKKCSDQEIQSMTVNVVEEIVKNISASKNLSQKFVLASKLLNDVILKDEEGKKILDKLPKDLAKTVKGISAVAEIMRKGSKAAGELNAYTMKNKTGVQFDMASEDLKKQVADVMRMRAVEEKLRAFATEPNNANGINPFFGKIAEDGALEKLDKAINESFEYIDMKRKDVTKAVSYILRDTSVVREGFREMADEAFGKSNDKLSKEEEKEMHEGLEKAVKQAEQPEASVGRHL